MAALNSREPNSDSGIIGAGERRSTSTKATSAATPATAVTITLADPSPFAPASTSAYVTPARPKAPRTAPGKSKCPTTSSLDSGTYRSAIATTAAASGRLIRKIQRHDAYSIR